MTDYTTTNNTKTTAPRRMRWSWFPSLHFGDGMLLSVLVLTTIMMRRYGLNNSQIALYVSLLAIPFTLRPLFEMVVTYFRGTTKVWILSAEFISALSLWLVAFTLPTTYWLQGTLCFMPFVVVSGVFYSIAANRFYTDDEATANHQHRLFALLSKSLALLFGIGVMTMLAGNMEVVTRNVRYSWSLVFYIMAGVEFCIWLWQHIPTRWQETCSSKERYIRIAWSRPCQSSRPYDARLAQPTDAMFLLNIYAATIAHHYHRTPIPYRYDTQWRVEPCPTRVRTGFRHSGGNSHICRTLDWKTCYKALPMERVYYTNVYSTTYIQHPTRESKQQHSLLTV